jgi:hypothetical protein
MESIELPDFKEKPNTPPKLNFFIEALKEYSNSENFFSYFPEVLSKVAKPNIVTTLIQNLLKNLNLNIPTSIAISLSLYLSDKLEFI